MVGWGTRGSLGRQAQQGQVFGTPVGAKPDFPATKLPDVCEVEGRVVSKICFGADPRGRAARITKVEEGWDGPAGKGAGKASRVGKVACAH